MTTAIPVPSLEESVAACGITYFIASVSPTEKGDRLKVMLMPEQSSIRVAYATCLPLTDEDADGNVVDFAKTFRPGTRLEAPVFEQWKNEDGLLPGEWLAPSAAFPEAMLIHKVDIVSVEKVTLPERKTARTGRALLAGLKC